MKTKLFLIVVLIGLITKDTFAQATKFWGMTNGGGASDVGVIFNTDNFGANQTVTYSFEKIEGENPTRTKLCETPNGKLYGMTSYGGVDGYGIIFSYDTVTEISTNLFDFDGVTNGSEPQGGLVLANNGMLYGMTTSGGTNDLGVIFEFDPSTNIYTKKLDFDGATNGKYPYGNLIQAQNGKLYGMASQGGINNLGVLFEYDILTDTYTKKLDFDGTNTGARPGGDLMQASNGNLYGITSAGGALGYGVIFEYDPVLDVYSNKYDFDLITGAGSFGSLLQASNGKLYGMTYYGGVNSLGVIFEYNITADTYTLILDFDGVTNGSLPNTDLVQASNGKLYGMTSEGGTNGLGVLFEYDYVLDTCIKKLDFDGAGNGSSPQGSLIQASNGKLYGLTTFGGNNDGGVLFDYNTLTDAYTKKLDFNVMPNGGNPVSSLLQASNGKLYGITTNGGTDENGVLFEYNPVTSTYSKKLDFETSTGNYPGGELIEATNGKLYGMTSQGGINDYGVLFEYDPLTESYTIKFNFDGMLNGGEPEGALLQASNGKLYGITNSGGANFSGVLFEYNLTTDTYLKKLDFDNVDGSYPSGNLIESTNGKLYGMTSGGGVNFKGVLFEYDPVTGIYTKKLDFDGTTNGGNPKGSLTQAINGKLYGMTRNGGVNDYGVIFEFDPATELYSKKLDFDGTTSGSSPKGSFLQAVNGNLYGITYSGGTNDMGVIFEYNPITDLYTKKLDFDGVNGSYSLGSLIEINNCINTTNAQTLVECAGFTITVGSNTYNSTGIYTDILAGFNGCDSTVTTDLTVENAIDVTVTNTSPTLTANQAGATYQWLDCDNANAIIPSETAQSFTATANGNYAVEVIVGSCVDTSACENISTVGIKETTKSSVSIYPNPTTGVFNVNLSNNKGLINYTISTVEGRLVVEGRTNESIITLDLQNESKGVYFLKINEENTSKTYKVIKE